MAATGPRSGRAAVTAFCVIDDVRRRVTLNRVCANQRGRADRPPAPPTGHGNALDADPQITPDQTRRAAPPADYAALIVNEFFVTRSSTIRRVASLLRDRVEILFRVGAPGGNGELMMMPRVAVTASSIARRDRKAGRFRRATTGPPARLHLLDERGQYGA